MKKVFKEFFTITGRNVLNNQSGGGRSHQGPYFSRPIPCGRFHFMTAHASYSDLGEWGDLLGVQFQGSTLPSTTSGLDSHLDQIGFNFPRTGGDEEWQVMVRDGYPRLYRLRELRHGLSPMWGNAAMGYGTSRGPIPIVGQRFGGGPTYYGYEGRGESGGRGQPLGHMTPIMGLERVRCAITVPVSNPPPDAFVTVTVVLFTGMNL